ncbi:polymer-forming cytoskeletal protein [Sulfurovum sp.]|uniref:bactofilin family protein n=1 Tax=Sulfurovum sp. TaxID=1969726 RepID=UPI002867FFBA|nr:polymer-forming cytoskeletal protein [Sulfurovum sp.]
MGFFVDRRKKLKQNKISSATIITSCMEITGNLKGTDTIHIDGKVVGDISVENTLVIGKNGVVIGNVIAKNAIINGELQGSLQCDTLEILKTGKLSELVHVKHLIVDGIIEGEVIGIESINILKNAKLNITDTTELQKVVDKKIKPKRS